MGDLLQEIGWQVVFIGLIPIRTGKIIIKTSKKPIGIGSLMLR